VYDATPVQKVESNRVQQPFKTRLRKYGDWFGSFFFEFCEPEGSRPDRVNAVLPKILTLLDAIQEFGADS
jgi:hypothetical protein